MIVCTKVNDDFYELHWINGGYIGTAEKLEDGYFYWCADGPSRAWSQRQIEALVGVLERLNKDWDAQVQAEIGGANEPV